MKHIPKNMLVTGSAGFIGANFVKQVLEKHPNLKIVSLDALTYAGNVNHLSGLGASRHTFVKGDICDYTLVLQLLSENKIDTLIHFAAQSHVDRSIDNPRSFIETNVVGTLTLLQAAREVWANHFDGCRFHHISTDEVYGSLNSDAKPFTEQHPYSPNSPYSASKAGADHLVRAFSHTYGLPVTLSHCSNNYGPMQHDEKLIPTIIKACMNHHEIPIYGNGSNIRDWIYVEDHCEAIDAIIRMGALGQTYNVGGECEISNLALAKMICQIMDKKHPGQQSHETLITFVTDRAGHDWRYAIDNRKIKQALGWCPKTLLSAGLEKTIDYYIQYK